MAIRLLQRSLIVAAALMWPFDSFAACVIGKLADLPVRMEGLRAFMPVKLNGNEVQMVVDSGAFYSTLSPPGAAALNLKARPTSAISYVQGVNGTADVLLASVDTFVLDNIPMKGKWEFLVGGSDLGGDAVGLLGENILGLADTEYDFSKGIIRLMKPMGCADKPLAYWAATEKLPMEEMNIQYVGKITFHIVGTAELNGHKIRVQFDTGAPTSVLTLAAAKRAGVTPQSPGVVPTGTGYGVGRGRYQTWVGPFASLKLGGEETRHTRIRFGDVTLGEEDMLLGMDFFLSHHIYVANSQHKLYFTYNGGPVFNLTSLTPPPEASDQSSEPQTAAEFAARGRALIGRHDFEQAIDDLGRAIQMDGTQSDYFYQRALAYVGQRQIQPAVSDLDQALKLKAEFSDALLLRARMELVSKDAAAARSDLDSVDTLIAHESDLRLEMSSLYEAAEAPEQSLHQLDLWIAAHDVDARLPAALNERCWRRGMWNREVEKAEADCKRSLRLAPKQSATLDSLGWVELRLNHLDKSVEAFNSALQQQPKLASSLYGRGIAEKRLGKAAAADADIAAAHAERADIDEQMHSWDINP